MATIHQAQIRPSKLELISRWLPNQPWWAGEDQPVLSSVGAFRFDDPAGAVGVETILVRADDGTLVQVPLTYRGAPLSNGEAGLIGTMVHSVLGDRWVYDGCTDPVYASALAGVVLGDGVQAAELVETEDGPKARKPSVAVVGSGSGAAHRVDTADAVAALSVSTTGSTTAVHGPGWELQIARLIDPSVPVGADPALTGTWSGQITPVWLATGRLVQGAAGDEREST